MTNSIFILKLFSIAGRALDCSNLYFLTNIVNTAVSLFVMLSQSNYQSDRHKTLHACCMEKNKESFYPKGMRSTGTVGGNQLYQKLNMRFNYSSLHSKDISTTCCMKWFCQTSCLGIIRNCAIFSLKHVQVSKLICAFHDHECKQHLPFLKFCRHIFQRIFRFREFGKYLVLHTLLQYPNLLITHF